VPPGCIVRNTFLEWLEEECEDEVSPELIGDQRPVEPSAGVAEKFQRRRALSCPEEALLATERLAPEGQRRYQEPHQQQWQEHQLQQQWQSPEKQPRQQQGRRTDFGGRQRHEDVVEHGRRPQPSALDDHRSQWSYGSQGQTPTASQCDKSLANDQDSTSWYGNWSPSAGGHSPGTGQKSQKGKQQQMTSLILRGLPFNVTEGDVASFIDERGAFQFLAPGPKPIALLTNPQGRPSGFAEVQLIKTANYYEVFKKLNMQSLGGRYIEVLTPRGNKAGSNWASPTSRHGRQREQKDSWWLKTGATY